MHNALARGIATGTAEAFDEAEVLHAWQHLVRTGEIKLMSPLVQTQAIRLQRGALIT
jgi:hypothetical protein